MDNVSKYKNNKFDLPWDIEDDPEKVSHSLRLRSSTTVFAHALSSIFRLLGNGSIGFEFADVDRMDVCWICGCGCIFWDVYGAVMLSVRMFLFYC